MFESDTGLAIGHPTYFGHPRRVTSQIFLEALRWSLESKATSLAGIKAAYISYRIWLVQNARVFETRW